MKTDNSPDIFCLSCGKPAAEGPLCPSCRRPPLADLFAEHVTACSWCGAAVEHGPVHLARKAGGANVIAEGAGGKPPGLLFTREGEPEARRVAAYCGSCGAPLLQRCPHCREYTASSRHRTVCTTCFGAVKPCAVCGRYLVAEDDGPDTCKSCKNGGTPK